MLRIDGHLHVGCVWGGRNESTPAPADECAEYLLSNEITHACVCYSDRPSMDSLVALCPDVKFYKLQWITHFHQTLDDDIQGIKLHSHRGQGFSFGSEDQGLDYSSKEMRKFLASLPEGLIVQYHTQGSASLNNISRPYQIGKLAAEHRHLKHVIVHAGSYGLQSYYPSTNDAGLIITAISQEMLVREAVLMANRLANCWLDGSAIIGSAHFKTAELLYNTTKASLGSDWPYSKKSPYGPIPAAEKECAKFIGREGIDALMERTLHFLETPLAQLYEEEGVIVNEHRGQPQEYQDKLAAMKAARLAKRKKVL